MKKYVTLSLEVHLFLGRIMKEHALFLLAAFSAGETAYRKRADWFRRQFEELPERTVQVADGMVGTGGHEFRGSGNEKKPLSPQD